MEYLTEKEQKAFDIAIVEPLAKLEEEEVLLIDSMVGGDSTPTVIDMSENEIEVPEDYTEEEKRSDILCYSTKVLTKDITVTQKTV